VRLLIFSLATKSAPFLPTTETPDHHAYDSADAADCIRANLRGEFHPCFSRDFGGWRPRADSDFLPFGIGEGSEHGRELSHQT